MNNKIITFTTKGGDGNSWALDQILLNVKNGLLRKTNWCFVESISFADIVIFGWYPGYLENRFILNKNQIIICFMENDTKEIYPDLSKNKYFKRIDIWLTMSTKEREVLKRENTQAYVMPFTKLKKIENNNYLNNDFEKKLNPLIEFKKNSNQKLILSAQRDSSLVNGEWIPKRQKNPKYLLELYKEAKNQELQLMLVLCGPRRHWIVDQLDKNNLPYIFLGSKPTKEDDYLNKLPRELILRIIQECDFSIVTSLWEGGPLCIIESIEKRKLTFSTSVGFSKDLLPKEVLLSGEMLNDINAIKNIINSDFIHKNALNEALNKYNNFVELDLEKIIAHIGLISKSKHFSKMDLLIRYKFYKFDFVLVNLENFIRRLKLFIGRKLKKFFSI